MPVSEISVQISDKLALSIDRWLGVGHRAGLWQSPGPKP